LHHQSFRIFLLALLLLNSAVIWGQNMNQGKPKRARTLEDYQTSTLKQINDLKTDSTLLPLHVKVTYTSLIRPLPPAKKDFLRTWANRYAGSVDHYTAHYKTEMQFIEDGVEHWLSVTTKALEEIQKQMKKGQAVDLYLIRIRETAPGNPSNWLLLIEKFQEAK
jgi:hypothetical protein